MHSNQIKLKLHTISNRVAFFALIAVFAVGTFLSAVMLKLSY